MRNRYITIFVVVVLGFALSADGYGQTSQKLSPMLRMLLDRQTTMRKTETAIYNKVGQPRVCALVKTAVGGDKAIVERGCRVLNHVGSISIVDIPLTALPMLAADDRICRIEAERGNILQLDSTARLTDVETIREAETLPRVFTGKGVVMGVMDVGFDLTHPTFRDAQGEHIRIKRFWDQLSVDTLDSRMYVGAEYATEADILNYAHSRDGYTILHGTHTLGIAAGNGAGTPYVGMAPESDICIVSNAVTSDREYIAESDLYRYTTATDIMGFKYIFDYAAAQGKPCVISFSEGQMQDFSGDDILYYEALDQLVGEGRIIVVSAGNTGTMLNYVFKSAQQPSVGTFMQSDDDFVRFLSKSHADYTLRTTFYNAGATHELLVATQQVTATPDSTLSDTIRFGDDVYVQTLTAYNSCYDAQQTVLDVRVEGQSGIGVSKQISFEIVGEGVEAELYRVHGSMAHRSANPVLKDGDDTHGILSPGSAPSVICVGSTTGRRSFVNANDSTVVFDAGALGQRSWFSSIGPTFDDRPKPDVMAPGANVVSSCSSFYYERNPEYANVVTTTSFDGNTYPWSAESGTSMSAPAVGGIVALWLEANPRLTPTDVLGVIARTSRPCGDYGDNTANYCGYGAIDAYAGLLDVLNLSGIENLSHTNPQLAVSVENAVLYVDFSTPMPRDWHLLVYSIEGKLCSSKWFVRGARRYAIDLSSLPKGVYAVQIDTDKPETTGSVLIRI